METQKKEDEAPEVTTTSDAVAPQVVEEKKKDDGLSDSDEEEKLSDAEKQLWEKIDGVLKEYHLTAFQQLAARKFIKDKVGNPKD